MTNDRAWQEAPDLVDQAEERLRHGLPARSRVPAQGFPFVLRHSNATAAQKQGGTAATAALIRGLRQSALHVQMVVQRMADPAAALAALLANGFDAVSTSRAQPPLPTPTVHEIKNVGTGRLQLTLKPVPNARRYEVQSQAGTGGWTSAGMFADSRAVSVTGLTPGTTYTLQVRALGGSTGTSEWSNPVSHMSL